MTTKRYFLFVGLLIAVTIMGLYAAKATSAIASEALVKSDAPATTSPATQGADRALQADGARPAEALSSSGADQLDCSNPCAVSPLRCAKCCYPSPSTCDPGYCVCY